MACDLRENKLILINGLKQRILRLFNGGEGIYKSRFWSNVFG